MSISKIGRRAEEYVANYMFKKGWVAILIPKGFSGQPFDLITFKDNKYIAGDVKHITTGDRFYLSRIEPNQTTSFKLMELTGNTNTGLFLKFKDDENVYFKKWSDIDFKVASIHKGECMIL